MIAVKSQKTRRPRQGELLIICPLCECRCLSYSASDKITYYKCTNPRCKYTTKRARPTA